LPRRVGFDAERSQRDSSLSGATLVGTRHLPGRLGSSASSSCRTGWRPRS
jgi:hypothetical protein